MYRSGSLTSWSCLECTVASYSDRRRLESTVLFKREDVEFSTVPTLPLVTLLPFPYVFLLGDSSAEVFRQHRQHCSPRRREANRLLKANMTSKSLSRFTFLRKGQLSSTVLRRRLQFSFSNENSSGCATSDETTREPTSFLGEGLFLLKYRCSIDVPFSAATKNGRFFSHGYTLLQSRTNWLVLGRDIT